MEVGARRKGRGGGGRGGGEMESRVVKDNYIKKERIVLFADAKTKMCITC